MSMRFENTTRIEVESGSPAAATVTLDGFADAVATAGGLEVRGLAALDTLAEAHRSSSSAAAARTARTIPT